MRKLFALLAVFFAFRSAAQVKAGGTYKDYFLEGSYLLLEDNFPMAQDNFQAAYNLDSSSANINYMLGICYMHSATLKPAAESHLALATRSVSKTYRNDDHNEKNAPPLAHYYYAQALHINYKFDEAIAQYDLFAKYVNPKDKEWKKMLDRGKATSIFAKKQVESPINIKLSNLGDSINSIYPEYSPVMSTDERMLIYTTRRPNTTGGMKDLDGFYNEDIVVSYKDDKGNWSSPQAISNNINTGGMEAPINLSNGDQTLIIYKDGGEGTGGNIYYSVWEGKDWSTLKEFGSDVNTKYWESHACLSLDGNLLFFVSDRPGGFGGRDIYRCVKLPNGKWSKAYNMGPTINTEYDEDGAFIHPDGKTFIFASKGHQTMGGFDIMTATLNEENKFSEVTNIGYPINTTDDDVFFVVTPDGKRGYFSSAKDGGFGEKDIYMISIPDAKEKPLALYKGQIIPADGEKLPEDLMIEVKDKQTGEIIGQYRPKVVNGVFSIILPPGREYNVSYQAPAGEEFYNEDVFVTNDVAYQEINREVNLEPVKLLGKIKAREKAIILNTIVFDNSKNKKPVNAAKIVLEEKDGGKQSFNSDEKGKYDGVLLQPEKRYTIFAESEGKKSAIADISTIGAKSGKVINEVLYLEGKPGKVTSKDLLLNVVVKNNKTKKIVPNATIVLTDAEGHKYEANTDEKGSIKGIELSSDTKYELIANSDGRVSDMLAFNTTGIKGSKTISKTLFIGNEKIGGPDAESAPGDVSPSEYEFFFKYNKNTNDDDQIWESFVNHVVELSKKKKAVYITIKASASKVPTRAFRNNAQLASTRAKNLQKKIKEAVEARGGNVKTLRFTKSSKVGGPRYRGDHDLNRATFEKYQFVKAKAR